MNSVRAGHVAGSAPQNVILAPAPVAIDADPVVTVVPPTDAPGQDEPEEVAHQSPQASSPPGDAPPQSAPLATAQRPATAAVEGAAVGAKSSPPLRRPPAATDIAIAIAAVNRAMSEAPQPAGSSQVPVGVAVARIGAFSDHETAHQAWQRVQGLVGDELDGKQKQIVKAGQKYLLRVAGFANENDAQSFCAVLQAGKIACNPAGAPAQ